MLSRVGLYVTFVSMTLLSTPSWGYQKRGGIEEDYAAIDAIEVQWQAAYSARDFEVLADLYTEDGWVMAGCEWNVARFALTYQSMSGREPIYDSGRALILYKKGYDGQWRIHRDMDTPTPDAASALVIL